MAKGFVILTHSLTAAQQVRFQGMLAGFAWWHYLPQSWLVHDPAGQLNCEKLRDLVQLLDPTQSVLVLEVVPSGNWASFLGPEAHNWLHTEWKS